MGEAFNSRKPSIISDLFVNPIIREKIPENLEKMCGDKQNDLNIAIKNAELRRKNINKQKGGGLGKDSFNHIILLIQELYEAGWEWDPPLAIE